MRNIIIDCDPGHDDAIAIFMALAHQEQLRLLGVTTVCGNNTVELVTTNAQRVLQVAQANVPLVKGAAHPLVGDPIISSEFHGATGMDGPVDVETPTYPVVNGVAVEWMKEQILSHDKVTLVPMAPLTNIALLLTLYPEVIPHIELISLMGGGIKGGNYTSYAEFNIAVDPEAAKIVFASGIPIVMSGLDVTEQAVIYPQNFGHLRTHSGLGKFFAELMDFYAHGAHQLGLCGLPMHDGCAVAYLLQPELFSGYQATVDVCLQGECRGQTIQTMAQGSTLVLNQVNQPEFEQLVLKSIQR